MKTFEGFRGGSTQICSENEGGGSLQLSNIQKGGSAKFHLV